SEQRRVGEEGRPAGGPDYLKKKKHSQRRRPSRNSRAYSATAEGERQCAGQKRRANDTGRSECAYDAAVSGRACGAARDGVYENGRNGGCACVTLGNAAQTGIRFGRVPARRLRRPVV